MILSFTVTYKFGAEMLSSVPVCKRCNVAYRENMRIRNVPFRHEFKYCWCEFSMDESIMQVEKKRKFASLYTKTTLRAKVTSIGTAFVHSWNCDPLKKNRTTS